MGHARHLPEAMTLAQFLIWDSGDDRRYELIDGAVAMMAPVSNVHGTLAVALASLIRLALREKYPWRAQAEAGLWRPERPNAYFQADLVVTAEPLRRDRQIVEQPILIAEILSPTTESHDRMVKVPDYRLIPSVREIMLVHQDRAYVEVLRRLDGSRWLTLLAVGRDATAHLDSLGLDLPLAELYQGIDVDTVAAGPLHADEATGRPGGPPESP